MTIIDALTDKHLLGGLPQFADLTSWRNWLAFLRAVYGLTLSADDLDSFRTFTGRTAPQPGG